MSGAEQTTDVVPTPERNLAEVLCSLNGSWTHHDRTDDYPCSACLVVVRTHLAAARADERDRFVTRLRWLASEMQQGYTPVSPAAIEPTA